MDEILTADEIKLLKAFGASDNWINTLIENGTTMAMVLETNETVLQKKGLNIDELKKLLSQYISPDQADNQIIPLPSSNDQAIIRSRVVEAFRFYQERSVGMAGASLATTMVVKNAISVRRVLGRANISVLPLQLLSFLLG